MVQTTLFQVGHLTTRPRAFDLDEPWTSKSELRAAEAARLGLSWPARGCRRSVGRPNRKELWENAVAQALWSNQFENVAQLQDIAVPSWYRSGHCILQPSEPSSVGHEVLDTLGNKKSLLKETAGLESVVPCDTVDGVAEFDEFAEFGEVADFGEVAELEIPKPKRQKVTVPPNVKQWFLSWCERMQHRGWCKQQCFREAQSMCPEYFAILNFNTIYRWEQKPAQIVGSERCCPLMVRAETQEHMAVMLHDLIKKGIPMSVPIALVVCKLELSKDGIDFNASRTWMRVFLEKIGLSYRRVANTESLDHSEEQKQMVRELLRCRLVWMMHAHSVPWSRVFNLDETAVRYLPLPGHGWQIKGVKAASHQYKGFITCTLCCCADPDVPMLYQIIHEGKTARVVPSGPHSPGMFHAFSENHWANQDTVFQFLVNISDSVGNLDTIVVLDMAPIHYAKDLCQKVKIELPNIHLLYVVRNCTSWGQPLDIAYMRRFKAQLGTHASRAYASDICQGLDPRGIVKHKPLLRAQLSNFVAAAVNSLDRVGSAAAGWKHFYVNEVDWAQVFDDAIELDLNGTLWDEPDWSLGHTEDIVEECAEDNMVDSEDVVDPELEEVLGMCGEPEEPEIVPAETSRPKVMSKFLALRLVYGTATKKDLAG